MSVTKRSNQLERVPNQRGKRAKEFGVPLWGATGTDNEFSGAAKINATALDYYNLAMLGCVQLATLISSGKIKTAGERLVSIKLPNSILDINKDTGGARFATQRSA